MDRLPSLAQDLETQPLIKIEFAKINWWFLVEHSQEREKHNKNL
jgi:hypothetical protein